MNNGFLRKRGKVIWLGSKNDQTLSNKTLEKSIDVSPPKAKFSGKKKHIWLDL
jgi:hypothetical protein